MIEIFKNERATGYDSFVQRWIPNYQFFIELLPRLLQNVEPKNLLVGGCGTGNEMLPFVQNESEWQITGVDPSPEMIIQAKQKLRDYSQVKLVQGEVSNLQTGKFGAATLLLVLHFLKDDGSKLKLLRQMAAQLLSGSPLILLDITGQGETFKSNLNILRSMLSPELDRDEVAQRLTRIEHELHHISEERLGSLVAEAGFEKPVRFFQTAVYMGWITRKIE